MKRLMKTHRSTAGRRPKADNAGNDTRAAILAAARRVFARRGLDGASVREVANAAKVNNAMIYYHFSDKFELYRAVLSDSFKVFDLIWENRIFSTKSTAREKIQKFVEELIRFHQANQELRRILSMEFACCGKNIEWLARNFYTRSYRKLANILHDGERNGELKKVDTSFAVATLVGMVFHSFILKPIAEYVTGRELDLSIKRFGAFVTEMFFDGLGENSGRGRIKLKRRTVKI